eukprot:TRINITY_DN50939_c0_g1_i1.p1 TRINITY_DN50939_c0_g1~~TRINITY_DN50939_c0_g1_i1.p1  ORF type:complete len:421 (+),score=42.38 TRINITY_DN50939_c0_g1_i1:81-1343(+)
MKTLCLIELFCLIATLFADCDVEDAGFVQVKARVNGSSPCPPLDFYKWERVRANTDDTQMWSKRAGLQAALIDDTILVMGGRTPLPPLEVPGAPFPIPISTLWNDTWRSDDKGKTWNFVTTAPWAARGYFKALSLKQQGLTAVVILGGQNFKIEGCPPGVPSCSDFFNDVWSSLDSGQTWTQLTSNAGWEPRAGLSAVVHNGALVVACGSQNDDSSTVPGGAPARIYFNDVWSSEDGGTTWKRLVKHGPFKERAGAWLESRGDWLYLFGGEEGFTCSDPTRPCPPYFNDVWRSRDGAQWNLVTASAGWSARPGFVVPQLSKEKEFVLFGGYGLPPGNGSGVGPPSNPTDMWRSADGKFWIKMPQRPWNARGPEDVKYDFTSLVVGTQVMTFGGDRETFNFFDPNNYKQVDNDVWSFGPER